MTFEVRDSLVVSFDSSETRGTIVLPYPHAGYGGHELVVSPDESHVALYLYSGQSEQGWELFSLSPELRHVGGLPYVNGEGDAPQFSPDGQWLAMCVAVERRVHGTDDDFEEVCDPDADDSVMVEWARLYVQHVSSTELSSQAVCVRVPRALDPDEVNEWATYDSMRFVSPTSLELTTPWQERIACSLPLSGILTATYPSR